LKLGVPDPGNAMLAAKARVQAFNAAFSAEAWDIDGTITAADAAARKRARMFMVVFLARKYQRPNENVARRRVPDN
jgi:hypothetical protein